MRIATPLAWLVACALAGCSSSTMEPGPESLAFPASFHFGTATAGFQVEMGCPNIARQECEFPSDWYDYVTTPSLLADKALYLQGDPPSHGPGFYELYPRDLQNVAGELHNDALRISIEWGRVFPSATDGVEGYDALRKAADPKALAFYHALLAAMKAKQVRPLVTVIHYVLPAWIHDTVGCHADIDQCKARGWLDRDRTVREAARYAGFLGREFGGEIDDWATLNEPLTAVILAGYLFQTPERTQPPAVTLKAVEARAAMVAEIEGHARMYDALHAADTQDADGDGEPVRVGLVYNLQVAAPEDPESELDVQGAKNLAYLMNQAFLDGAIKGDLDAALDGTTVHRDDLAGRMDFLGVNYYAKVTVLGTRTSILSQVSPLLTFQILTAKYDYGYARGIYEVLQFAKSYGIPLMITETGAVHSDQTPDDAPAWVARTLTWVKRAINDGAPVEGYYYWSLMDNYEWNHGMAVKMGLYAVNPLDPQKERKARTAVSIYGKIAASREIGDDVLAQYPTPR